MNAEFLVHVLCQAGTIPFIPFIWDILGSLCFPAFDCNPFMAGTVLLSSMYKQYVISNIYLGFWVLLPLAWLVAQLGCMVHGLLPKL